MAAARKSGNCPRPRRYEHCHRRLYFYHGPLRQREKHTAPYHQRAGPSDLGQRFYENTDIHRGSDKKLSAFRRQKIGFIFQQFHLLPVLTARENIIMPLLLDKSSRMNHICIRYRNFWGSKTGFLICLTNCPAVSSSASLSHVP